jgi:hypothetical protein
VKEVKNVEGKREPEAYILGCPHEIRPSDNLAQIVTSERAVTLLAASCPGGEIN